MISKHIVDMAPSPCFIIDEEKLKSNLEILADVKNQTGCKIILALKAYSAYATFPLIQSYLDGTTSSSLNEARLGLEEFGKSVHICAPAYKENEIEELLSYSDCIVFNSFAQLEKHKHHIQQTQKPVQIGLRINPEFSAAPAAKYDPCGPCSRFGIKSRDFTKDIIDNLLSKEVSPCITGLHFHTLCEQNADALEKTLEQVENNFSHILPHLEWLNFGGGHHITQKDYDIENLCKLILKFKQKYNLQIILEPGEAVILDAGILTSTVLDIVKNDMDIAILDTSAATHMPDVLEMPYRPDIVDSDLPHNTPYTYQLAGNTCLAGDVIGDYSFQTPLKPGDKLIFENMALYTMVKTNTFNGINLPSIAILTQDGELNVIKTFDYQDFKSRLS